MTIERMLRFLVLRGINNDMVESNKFSKYIKTHYDSNRLLKDYETLGTEFLQEYALETPRKSE